MKIYRHHVVFSLPIILLIQAATPQQPNPAGSSSLVTSSRPLWEVAHRLQQTYGKVVTYEEPLLTWRAELQTKPGADPERKWQLFPRTYSFSMPDSRPGADLGTLLENTIAAYHQQSSGNSGNRFQLLSSKLGYHIVPVQMHDESGRSVPTTSALDRIITVPSAARTANEHLLALGAALNSALPFHVDVAAFNGNTRGFNTAFRAQPDVLLGEFIPQWHEMH